MGVIIVFDNMGEFWYYKLGYFEFFFDWVWEYYFDCE